MALQSPKKTKLILAHLGITMADIPIAHICHASHLGPMLHKLSLASNPRLEVLPVALVQELPRLERLDLSSCSLRQLPLHWNLPCLKLLNLHKNLLRDFPDESILTGIPALQTLNLSWNQISAVVIPEDKPYLLPNLTRLDLSDNGLEHLPDELDQLRNLKILLLKNNFVARIPMRVCDMKLDKIDITDNITLVEPPLQYCQSGPEGMRRFWRGLALDDSMAMEEPDQVSSTTNTNRVAKHMTFVIPRNPFALASSADDASSDVDTVNFVSRDSKLDDQVSGLLGAIVVVGLYDGMSRKIVRVGSGFLVNSRKGLVVTASHTLMNIWCDAATHEYGRKYEYGKEYYGLLGGKVVIGVIPRNTEYDASYHEHGIAVFRYFAKIVAKDPSMESGGDCRIDVCLLRITDRFVNDVDGEGEDCGHQAYRPLLGNHSKESFRSLELADSTKEGDKIVILGYGQGYEDALGPDSKINRIIDYVPGHVSDMSANKMQLTGTRFNPIDEIAVTCPTVGGHSGGPCVNERGQVIGIVSRADPSDNKKCYLAPTSQWRFLVDHAKRAF